MATKVMLKPPLRGLTRRGYFGFSWTLLILGWWVPMFRGALGVAALHRLFCGGHGSRTSLEALYALDQATTPGASSPPPR